MALWTPSEIATELWLDADDASTITTDVGVSEWADKSGNANHALVELTELQPATGELIGGLNALGCSSDGFKLTTEIATARTVFFITDVLNGSSENVDMSVLFGSSVAGESYTFVRNNLTDYTISIDGNAVDTGHASINGGPVVAGGNIDLSVTTAVRAAPALWYTDFDAVCAVERIASVAGSPNHFYLIGNIGEVLVLDTVATTETRQTIEGYLAWKWGMEANLPADHPHKDAAPVIGGASQTGSTDFIPPSVAVNSTGTLPITGYTDITPLLVSVDGVGDYPSQVISTSYLY